MYFPVAHVRTVPARSLFDAFVSEVWNEPSVAASPRCDVYTDRSKWYVEVELPGIAKRDVHVSVEGDALHVKAERTEGETRFLFLRRERPIGKVEQSFRLGQNLDAERLEAKFEDGLLTISVPLKASALGREIPVT
jgi:HSP20 family protein